MSCFKPESPWVKDEPKAKPEPFEVKWIMERGPEIF
jgi:hypothetical protein